MTDEIKKPREWAIEKKLSNGINRAFDPDNVEGDQCWHNHYRAIEYSAIDILQSRIDEISAERDRLSDALIHQGHTLRSCISEHDKNVSILKEFQKLFVTAEKEIEDLKKQLNAIKNGL